MNTRFFLIGIAVAVVALSGCTALQRPPGPGARVETRPDVRPEARPEARQEITRIQEMEQVSTLINYAHSLGTLPAEEQRREFSGTAQAYTREPSPVGRVKLALLLSTPGAPFQDDNRALNLLEPFVAGGAGGSAASASNAGPLRRFAGLLHAQLAERMREQKRSAVLREQLDALKAVERSLMERGQGGHGSQGRPR
jgi:hypothetical protein